MTERPPRARRMAEATTSPIYDRHLASPPSADRVVAGVRVPQSGSAVIDVDGRSLALTNLDRVLYPEAAFTKADSIAYYLAVADVMLPHLHDRALTVGRFPGGVDGRGFAQAEIPGRPSWVSTARLRLAKGEDKSFTVAEDRATLVWLAQMGTIELHTFLGRASALDRPTAVVFDLDPAPPATLLDAARVALLLRDVLSAFGITAFVKTSGSVGIHVEMPMVATYEATRAFATGVARDLAARHPEQISDRLERAGRAGKVLIDARQNSMRLTTVVPYSLRSTPRPYVSTPVTWEEIAAAVDAGSAAALRFEAGDIPDRVARLGDPFAPVLPREAAAEEPK